MAKKTILCPRCMNLIKRNEDKCSQCGMTRAKIEAQNQEEREKRAAKQAEADAQAIADGGVVVDTRASFAKEASDNKEEPQENINEARQSEAAEEKAQPEAAAEDEIDRENRVSPSYDEGIDSTSVGSAVTEETVRKRHKHKARQKDQPEYTIDENGEYNIDTRDVTYLEGLENPTYSVKKARGDFEPEKLKWWEIYKWADRMLARRKINKEVNKAARKTPVGIKRGVALVLCLLFGYIGAHNFYTKNYKRGWFMLISFIIIIPVVSIKVLTEFMGVFVGGGLGFIILALWLADLFGLITNRYRYRISKEEFISNLNVETRAKLGKKYIGLDRSVFKAKEEKRLAKYNKKKLKKQKNGKV